MRTSRRSFPSIFSHERKNERANRGWISERANSDGLRTDRAWAPIQDADDFLADCQQALAWHDDPDEVRIAMVTAERIRSDYECTTLERWWRIRSIS